jgi:hypothetical protein
MNCTWAIKSDAWKHITSKCNLPIRSKITTQDQEAMCIAKLLHHMKNNTMKLKEKSLRYTIKPWKITAWSNITIVLNTVSISVTSGWKRNNLNNWIWRKQKNEFSSGTRKRGKKRGATLYMILPNISLSIFERKNIRRGMLNFS